MDTGSLFQAGWLSLSGLGWARHSSHGKNRTIGCALARGDPPFPGDKVELAPGDHRRNLTTLGVPLNHLVGKRFMVGEAVLKGGRLNFPCKYLEKLLGLPATPRCSTARGSIVGSSSAGLSARTTRLRRWMTEEPGVTARLIMSAAFSASSRLFGLNGEASSARKKRNRATIAADVIRKARTSGLNRVAKIPSEKRPSPGSAFVAAIAAL
jgi:hypothetical protein